MSAYTITLWICLIGHTDVCVAEVTARDVVMVPYTTSREALTPYWTQCSAMASAIIKDMDPRLKPHGVEMWANQTQTCTLRRGA